MRDLGQFRAFRAVVCNDRQRPGAWLEAGPLARLPLPPNRRKCRADLHTPLQRVRVTA